MPARVEWFFGTIGYISPERRVPEDHPLRPIREMVNLVLKDMSRSFARIYAREGRPSIPPEHLLRALLLQVLYSVRSERMLMEQLDYNLLFRWFVGLNMDDRVWSPTTFSPGRPADASNVFPIGHRRILVTSCA